MSQQILSDYSQKLEQSYSYESNHDNGTEVSLKKVFGEIPLDIEDNAYLSIFRKNGKEVHNIALYPCKYIAELPRWAIKKYSKEDDIILDPFVGGGTTFIESKKLRRNCLGIDYNPYARLVSEVKSTIIEEKELLSEFKRISDNIKQDNGSDLPKPDFKGVDFWFNPDVIIGLSKIKK